LPEPSTATPVGKLSPEETRVETSLVVADHTLIALFPASAIYTFPSPSTARPEGWLRPVETIVVTV
jgi:hypothetical protein